MNSKDYWAKRSALDMVQYMRTADETATLIRETAEQALEVIQNEIKGIFSAFTSFGISEADAKRILSGGGTVLQQMRRAAEKLEDPKQKQALLSAINSAGAYRFRIQRLEEVGKQITEQCKQLYKAQFETTETALRSVAEDAYYHTMFNLQKETGLAFSFAQFPKKQIDKILAFNWSGAHFSQRIWRNTEILAQAIKDELLVSLLSGRSNAKTMQVIREQFNVNSFCAWRLVRTESSYVSNAAVSEGYKEADIEKYRFIATLDNRTSEECSALDGKVFKLADKKVGTNFPPMHPFCRSTTIADFGEETLKGLQRRARDKDGKVMKVPADMTYEEWAEQNGINAVKTLDKSSGSGIIKSLDIDDFELLAHGKISPEATKIITSVIKRYENEGKIFINDCYFGSLPSKGNGTPLLQIEPIGDKNIRLNVNTDIFSGRTVEEINEIIAKTVDNVAETLEEATIHECGHARLIKGMTIKEIEELYANIFDAKIEGVSVVAYNDGAEAIAEIEVLLARGDKVPQKALDFYNNHIKGGSS